MTSEAGLEKMTAPSGTLSWNACSRNPVTMLLRSPDQVERPCVDFSAKSQRAANISFQAYESGSPKDDAILSHSVCNQGSDPKQ